MTQPKYDLKTNESVLESLKDFARRSFDPENPLFPMFVLVTEDGHTEIVSGVMDGNLSKNAISLAVRERIKAINAVRIGFMSEAWALSSDDDPALRTSGPPRGSLEFHPKRKEVIHIIVEDKWGKGAMAVFDINRVSEKEATLSLQENDFLAKGTEYTGRFANFFDTPHVTTH